MSKEREEKNSNILNLGKNGIAFILKSITGKTPTILLVVLLLAAAGYYFKDQFIVALVNNQPIWRFTLIKEVEKQAGKTTLESLITQALILQEGNREGVKITDEEIDEELKKLEESLKAQGQDLDALLEAQGMKRAEIKEQIKIQKIVDKIVGGNIEVTDEEVDEYLKANESLIPEDEDIEAIKPTIREQLRQQKMTEKIREWLDSLREKAKINYFREF